MFESGEFRREIEQFFKKVAVDGNFVWINGNFGVSDYKKGLSEIVLAWKIQF